MIIFAMIGAMFAATPAVSQLLDMWTASWMASPTPPTGSSPGLPAGAAARSFENQTIVQIMRLSSGGRALRLRFTNEYGSKPLQLGAVRIALVAHDGTTIEGTQRSVTFGGRATTVIPAGAPWVSDIVNVPVPARARLRIAFHLPDETGLCTCHADGGETAEISPPGDYTDRPFTPVATFTARAFLSGIDVEGAGRRPVVVAFGDSITDGYLSSLGKDRRWPDRLAERLAADRRLRGYGVVNAGISGNRVLADGAIAMFGQSAVARFDRDVLSVPGVSTIILLAGINDIGRGLDGPTGAEALISGYRQLIDRAHARGLRVIGGTLLPYEGAPYYRPQGEQVRQAVNRWIRNSKAFDGVIDFDRVMRDPARPSKLRADLQSGDWLHPNDAGYRVMGDAIPLSALD